MTYHKNSDKERIREILTDHPKMKTGVIAQRVGCRPSDVSAVKREMGLTPSSVNYFGGALDDLNAAFIRREANKAGVEPFDVIQSIVTDARNGDG